MNTVQCFKAVKLLNGLWISWAPPKITTYKGQRNVAGILTYALNTRINALLDSVGIFVFLKLEQATLFVNLDKALLPHCILECKVPADAITPINNAVTHSLGTRNSYWTTIKTLMFQKSLPHTHDVYFCRAAVGSCVVPWVVPIREIQTENV